jgi:hypothetical protein
LLQAAVNVYQDGILVSVGSATITGAGFERYSVSGLRQYFSNILKTGLCFLFWN